MGKSRGFVQVVVLTLSFLLPGLVCAVFVVWRPASWSDLAAAALAATAWLLLLALINWWEFTRLWLRWMWLVVLAAAIGLAAIRAAAGHAILQPATIAPVGLALFVVAAWLLRNAVLARRHPGEAIELTFPLLAGRFLVTDGGDGGRSFLINYHYGFGQHRASGVARSMRYALDVVRLERSGAEARGLLPRRNDRYAIWEHPLVAPCEGVVAHVENDVPDNAAFGPNRPYGVGNHVIIRHGDVYVLLGHMRQGSIPVREGDGVRAGDPIGRVGNSGWTERPHLHVQAMRSPGGDWWHGDPVPMRFGGRFLVRNDTLRA